MPAISFILLTLILPIPVAHLWLHALLSYWRKFPIAFYLFGIILWVGSLIFALRVNNLFPNPLFLPNNTLGIIFTAVGLFLVFASIFSLGRKRFFLWAVLNPKKLPLIKKPKLFELFPHPAYLGYFLITIGNLFILANPLALIGLISFLFLTPVVIFMEEEELRNRING